MENHQQTIGMICKGESKSCLTQIGTCFAINKNVVVTCLHVVENETMSGELWVKFDDENEILEKVSSSDDIYVSEANVDLALIHLKQGLPKVKTLPILGGVYQELETKFKCLPFFTLGFHNAELEKVTSLNINRALTFSGNFAAVIEFEKGLNPGMSGSPVCVIVGGKLCLAGVLRRGNSEDHDAAVSSAVAADMLLVLLKKAEDSKKPGWANLTWQSEDLGKINAQVEEIKEQIIDKLNEILFKMGEPILKALAEKSKVYNSTLSKSGLEDVILNAFIEIPPEAIRMQFVLNRISILGDLYKENKSEQKIIREFLEYYLVFAVQEDVYSDLYLKIKNIKDKIQNSKFRPSSDGVITIETDIAYETYVYEIFMAGALLRGCKFKITPKGELQGKHLKELRLDEEGKPDKNDLVKTIYEKSKNEKFISTNPTEVQVIAGLKDTLVDHNVMYYRVVSKTERKKVADFPLLPTFFYSEASLDSDMAIDFESTKNKIRDILCSHVENSSEPDTSHKAPNQPAPLNIQGPVLFLGAHCDDIEIGCGGTMARCVSEKKEVFLGIATNSGDTRVGEAKEVVRILGLESEKQFKICDVPDGKLSDNIEKLRNWLNKIKSVLKPKTVFVHANIDPHSDHSSLGNAVRNVFINGASIIEYAIPKMAPNDYDLKCEAVVDITDFMDKKIEMLNCHKSQLDKGVYFGNTKERAKIVYTQFFGNDKGFAECFKYIKNVNV